MKKKICALLLALSVMFTVGAPVFAAEKAVVAKANSGIQPAWVNTDYAVAALNFEGDKAVCTAEVFAKSGTTKITATALLKRVNSNGTTTVKAWTGLSASGDSFYFDRDYYVASGYTYVFEIDAKVYRSGTVECVSESDYAYCG